MKRSNKIIIVVIFILVIFTITSVITIAIKRNPTEPVSKVIIESDNYDNPGSYHIEKSAKWLDTDVSEITFDVDTIPITDGRYKDVILVIDMSGSMVDLRLSTAKKNAKELVDVLLDNEHNSVSLITFDTSSEIISGFTKNKELIINEINDLSYRGATNYNAALNNVLEVLDGYEEKDNTDLIVLFLTDGYPNEDTPNQIGTYQILKSMYPYITVHGVQYEMGSQVVGDLRSISDYQWVATTSNLYNVLIEAVITPLKYENFQIIDYIDKDYFYINSINDIDVSMGSVSIEQEDGYEKVIWNLDNSITGLEASMKIKVKLKDEYASVKGLYPTNDREVINYKIVDNEEKEAESDKTPVLKNYYKVIYDTNTPTGCTLDSIEDEEHIIFTNVYKKQDKLTCNGYLFKGWKIEDNNVVRVNDDTFIMPEHDVVIKAIWSRVDISKSMDGKIYEKTTLYKAVENEALNGTQAKLYDGETDDGGGVDNVYYYTGSSVANNNVLFGGFCWRIVRTTDTGGVKMIFNGEPDESGKCNNYSDSYEIMYDFERQLLNSQYLYGTSYTYDRSSGKYELSGTLSENTWSDSTYQQLIGKFTCKSLSSTCSTIYYVDSYFDNRYANVVPFSSNHYSRYIAMNKYDDSSNFWHVGYMYPDIDYPANYKYLSKYGMFSFMYLNTEYFYGDSYTINNGKYKLESASRIESRDNYPNMVGKYTFMKSSSEDYEGSYLYYIVGVNGSTAYFIQLSNGEEIDDVNPNYSFGSEIIDNHDGTYTVSGDITTIKKEKWFDNYSNLINHYTCNSDILTCENPYYLTNVDIDKYNYVNVANNYKYGNSFDYDENTGIYKLKDVVQFYDYTSEYDTINNHHYTCFNTSGECDKISYIYKSDDTLNPIYYINIENGNNIQEVLNEMFSNDDINEIDSSIKKLIDIWYEIKMKDYSDYLEDTVFCNDRSIIDYGGWNPNGGDIKTELMYKGSNQNTELKCNNDIDMFTVSNDIGNGSLKYPIGLLSAPESRLNGYFLYNSYSYWLGTPYSLSRNLYNEEYYKQVRDSLIDSNNSYVWKKYTRPVISLKPNIEYTEGDGTEDKPFVVPTD